MMYVSKLHVVVIRSCVGLNVHNCGFERDGVLTPLLPFLGLDDEPGVDSPILH